MKKLKEARFMFNSIRSKLIVFIVVLLVVVAGATMGAVLYFFTDYSDTNAKEMARSGVEGLHNLLEDSKNDMKARAIMLAANPDVARAVEARDTAQVLAVMDKILKEAPIDSVMITDNAGIVIARTHEPTKKGDSVITQNGVSEAIKGNATSAIEPGTTVKLSAKAGAPVRNAQGQVIGVVSPGVTLSKNETVDNAKKLFNVDTTLFLGDVRESTTITVDGKRQIGTKLDPKIADIVLKQGKRFDGEATILGMPYLTSYEPIIGPAGKPIGVMFAGKPLIDAHAARNKMGMTVGVATLLALILASVATLFMANRITGPLRKMGEALASGDLTRTLEVTTKDEVGVMSQHFNTMIEELRTLVRHVQELSQTLVASSEELAASAEQSSEVSHQVAQAITEVAAGTSKQISAVNDASAIVEEVSAGAEEVAATAETITGLSHKSTAATLNGSSAIDRAVQQMGNIGEGSKAVNDAVEKLADSSRHIGEIVNVISGIAGQTNLLALNAAIEAARAGEQGRGFAVVAEEVRKLAEQSESATKEITTLIAQNHMDIQKAVQAMEVSSSSVKVGIDVVNAAGVTFREISQLTEEVSTQMEGISSAIGEIAKGSERIVVSIRDIETVSKDSAGHSQSVSAAAEEMTASMTEISSSSQSLAKMAQELQVAIARFRL
jgi:methyl-accepting chemotaxis protein